MNRRDLVFLSGALVASAFSRPVEPTVEPTDVSMISLIATPKRFDRHRVRLIAFLRLEFEGNALYLHEEDFLQRITDNALWIDVPVELRTDAMRSKFDKRYVLVEGRFNSGKHGHLGLFSGTIEDVNRLEPWTLGESSPRDPN